MMKWAIVIADGAADLPQQSLGGRTPLEVAEAPHLDRIARQGRFGTTRNIPEGMAAGSDVAILSVLGYDPRKVYTGRAPLEALAQQIELADDDLVLRCNLVTVIDGEMVDYSAGGISQVEGRALLEHVGSTLGREGWEFYPGVGYRHLLVHRGCGKCDLKTTPPHDILGKPIAEHLPSGRDAADLISLMNDSRQLLEGHEINRVRADLGERAATQIWLWGEGFRPALEPFASRFGVSGAAITAVDLIRGIARGIGWQVIDVPGATGYLDTNYQGKTAAAIAALDEVDLVLVHVEAPDECGHEGNATGKIQAIENIDRLVVGPLLEHLEQRGGDWRLMALPDHPTPVNIRTHTADAVPVGIIGKDISPVCPGRFTERDAARSGFEIHLGHELMEFFLLR